MVLAVSNFKKVMRAVRLRLDFVWLTNCFTYEYLEYEWMEHTEPSLAARTSRPKFAIIVARVWDHFESNDPKTFRRNYFYAPTCPCS
jgi:hypothetical protein